MTGLEILNQLLLGRTSFHRSHDAWDLLDGDGRVVAVLCPRQRHVSIAPPAQPGPPAPAGRLMPHREKVKWKVSEDDIETGPRIIEGPVLHEPPS